MNKTIQMGRLTRDPEFAYTKSNKEYCKFTIAQNDKYKKEVTYFFNCTAWGKTAKTIYQYFKKGNRILIEGSLKQEKWENKEGKKQSAIIINVDGFTFIENASSGNSGGNQENQAPNITFEELGNSQFVKQDNDEVPF
jgi:single-strand DNA-binding protein